MKLEDVGAMLPSFLTEYLEPFGHYSVTMWADRTALLLERDRDGRLITVALPSSRWLMPREYLTAVADAVDQALTRIAEEEAKPWD